VLQLLVLMPLHALHGDARALLLVLVVRPVVLLLLLLVRILLCQP
jgi:hypothetical protein